LSLRRDEHRDPIVVVCVRAGGSSDDEELHGCLSLARRSRQAAVHAHTDHTCQWGVLGCAPDGSTHTGRDRFGVLRGGVPPKPG
jgi:hypothetical protein